MSAFAVIGKIATAKRILFTPKEPTRLCVFFIVLWDVYHGVDGAVAVVDVRGVQKITVMTQSAETFGVMSACCYAHFPIETLFLEIFCLLYQKLMHPFNTVVMCTDVL